jgi:hypothetical protein
MFGRIWTPKGVVSLGPVLRWNYEESESKRIRNPRQSESTSSASTTDHEMESAATETNARQIKPGGVLQ